MAPAAPGSAPLSSTGRLNEQGLRSVFNKFDTDRSGAVSTEEMASMVKALNLNMSAAEITTLMHEADPDGSGSVDFDEFKTVLKKQLASGGGGLSNVVTEASATFGWLNPMSWFGPEEPEKKEKKSAKAQPTPSEPGASALVVGQGLPGGAAEAARRVNSPGPSLKERALIPPAKAIAGASAVVPATAGLPARSVSPGGKKKRGGASPKSGTPKGSTPKGTPKGKKAGAAAARAAGNPPTFKPRAGMNVTAPSPGASPANSVTTMVVRSPAGSGVVQRMKVTQALVRDEYLRQAQQMRNEAQEGKLFLLEQEQNALHIARDNVKRGHQQAVDVAEAIEAQKQEKRLMGCEMKATIEVQMEQARQKKREYVAAAHNTVFDARKKKQGAARARAQYKIENAELIKEAARKERTERKEQTKATVRREEQAAQAYTAQVRYETRPEVRQEGAEMYQNLRNQVAENRRKKKEMDTSEMRSAQQAYMERAATVRRQVEMLHASTRASKEKLAEEKRQAAAMERDKLAAERERKRAHDEWLRSNKQQVHDEIHTWKVASMLDVPLNA